MANVESFIAKVRDSFIGSQQVYTEGSCYHFYLILKEVFPEAECWFDEDHVVTKIDGKFYDITGEIRGDLNLTKYECIPVLATFLDCIATKFNPASNDLTFSRVGLKASANSSAGNGRNTRSLISPTFSPFARSLSTASFAVPAEEPIRIIALSASSI